MTLESIIHYWMLKEESRRAREKNESRFTDGALEGRERPNEAREEEDWMGAVPWTF
jgi:hypothetical protein